MQQKVASLAAAAGMGAVQGDEGHPLLVMVQFAVLTRASTPLMLKAQSAWLGPAGVPPRK
jgi:hypothetical protein